MPGDAGQHVRAGARVNGEAELRRGTSHRLVDGEREGRAPELRRVEPQQQVMHDRVADQRHLENVVTRHSRGFRELGCELGQAAAHDAGQLLLRPGIHHHVRDPTHQVLAEADLRVHLACRRENLAARQVAQVTGDGRRADVEGDPEHRLVEPGPDTGDHGAVVNGDGDAPAPRPQRLLEAGKHLGITLEAGELPLPLECVAQATEVTRRRGQVGLLDLDVVEPDDRVDRDRMGIRFLADDLAVDLALGRHIDHELALDAGRAPEPSLAAKPTLGGVRPLDGADRREVRSERHDPVLCVLAFAHLDLAAPTDPTSTTDGVDVDPEPPSGVEHRRARCETASPTRRGEDDEMVGHRAPARRRRPCRGDVRARRSRRRRPSRRARARSDRRPTSCRREGVETSFAFRHARCLLPGDTSEETPGGRLLAGER